MRWFIRNRQSIERQGGSDKIVSNQKVSSETVSTSDLLTWGLLVSPGIVLCKSGALLASWYYQGNDLSTSSDEERQRIAEIVSAAIGSLGGEYAIYVDACRVAAVAYTAEKNCHFSDDVSRAIDNERRQQFGEAGAQYETLHTITIVYMPPTESEARLANYMFDDDSKVDKGVTASRVAATKALQIFEQTIAELEDRLNAAITLDRMGTLSLSDNDHFDELLSHLKYCFTGELASVRQSPPGVFLDSTINAQPLLTGMMPKLGDDYIATVAIDAFPIDTYAGLLDVLSHLPFPYRWSTRWLCLDRPASAAALKKIRRRWKQRVRGMLDQLLNQTPQPGASINADAADMVNDVDMADSLNESGQVSFGYYTSVVVLRGKNTAELEERARDVRRLVIHYGFNARIEDVNTVEAFLGSLPGHVHNNVRRPMMHTIHLSNLLPLSSIWIGEARSPCPLYPANSPSLITALTSGSTPFHLNLHVGDVGHTLVFGPTGAGKSTLLALLAVQFRRYANAKVYSFDVGRSLEALTLGVGGKHFDITGDESGLNFSPLADLQADDVSWAAEWVETLFLLQGHSVTAPERNEITRALREVAQGDSKTLTILEITIQETHLKELLKPYTVAGAYGHLLDAESSDVSDDSWACWEIGELLNRDDKIRLPVLLYLFHQIERGLTGEPTLIILDEAWTMLGNPVFRDKIREWLKTLRKHNTAVIMATQSLSDATASGILDVLIESCSTGIYLPNVEARNGDNEALYRKMGLSEGEIDVLVSGVPKREYLVRSSLGSRLVDFRFGPIALAFCAVGQNELPDIRKAKEVDGDAWIYSYIKEKEVNHAEN